MKEFISTLLLILCIACVVLFQYEKEKTFVDEQYPSMDSVHTQIERSLVDSLVQINLVVQHYRQMLLGARTSLDVTRLKARVTGLRNIAKTTKVSVFILKECDKTLQDIEELEDLFIEQT